MSVDPLSLTARIRTARMVSLSVRSTPEGSQTSTISSLPTPPFVNALGATLSRVGEDISSGDPGAPYVLIAGRLPHGLKQPVSDPQPSKESVYVLLARKPC